MRRLLLLLMVLGLLAACNTQPQPAPPPTPPVAAPQDPATIALEPVKTPALTELRFTDAQHGWASGPTEAVWTADGGKTWTPGPRPGQPERPYKPVSLPDGVASWCSLGDGVVLAAQAAGLARSADRGATWSQVLQVPIGSQGKPAQVQCVPGGAWAMFIGGAGMSHEAYIAYRSVDAGRTWEPMVVSGWGTPPELNALSKPAIAPKPGPWVAVDAQTAFFVGRCDPCEALGTVSLLGTTDGGATWKREDLPLLREVSALAFVDGRHGWLLSGNRILATADGGATWQVQYPMGAFAPARAVAMVSETVGYGLGLPGDDRAVLATRDGGETWQPIATLPQADGRQRVPQGIYGLVLSFPTALEGWAVLPDGQLYRTKDGGHQWAAANHPDGIVRLRSVAFATPRVGCVTEAEQDRLYATDDGGTTWQRAEGRGGVVACAARRAGLAWVDGAPADATLLDARPGGTAWAKSDNGEVWVTHDQGRQWQRVAWPEPYREAVQSLSAVAVGRAWAVSLAGRSLRAVAGDFRWQVRP